ncbi:indolepyruvate ferredoxin oxidoreductase family protein [Massilia yuzhufengensis]|uniref:Indolepyruvate ferredoxin oxidoreductase n=1 Tax=Massilia yuzhufengensis TaxID=1164594 RepID=A0A1I1IZU8_9BURK|nr:indolepyruvate ferredoxin oxidoreductase family protein [Massilia yuzhufengensis]SFC41859.1 indolepyruvate ferredoxin oxidoreductase [Massilia yuzhufengensis]
MNSPLLRDVTLDDKYTVDQGQIFLSGVQMLARLPMLQKARDLRAGLNTAGYVSGYRGSPLGGLDMALWKAKKHLERHDVVFQPGLNEDLAATAVWGSQQVNLYQSATREGVFGMWYGKGPGVDRSADVLKHANSAGTSPKGGVLMLVGDDHAAKSSTVAHQSEHLLIACGIPVLYPSSVQEFHDYGLHGWAMSRHAGLWVAMKCVTDVVESSASVEIDTERLQVVLPPAPEGGLGIRWPDAPLDQEARLVDQKWYAALDYIRANRLNQVVVDAPHARFGIVAAGKAYLDLRQALVDLGLDEAACAQIGIRILKVGCVWPLHADDVQDFASGLDEILVVEEKRQVLEYAIKEQLFNWPAVRRPNVYGKFDERAGAGGEWSAPRGQWLLPARYELSPALIAKAVARRLGEAELPADLQAAMAARVAIIEAKEKEAARPRVTAERKPWFCSGCPHNTSTRVPEGSRALAGIGCHYMALWMDRRTDTVSQMGGEGVSWLGQMHFTSDKHVFVNLGDGTYFHSGLLAVRAAIAAKATVTYKILYNDAVAMTGGQPVDGTLTVAQIAQQVTGEGAVRVLVVSDAPEKYADRQGLPEAVTVHHRKDFDALQLELRDTAGVSVLIYDQTCATEQRRRRKRGEAVDPPRRAFINAAVCEGCGDCSVASNCLSVEPLDTPLGTKRKINQSSCNKDFSCVNGFCPSFVTAEGAQLRRPKAAGAAAAPQVPEPVLPVLDGVCGIVVPGVGGTGVVTVGALLGMAAHLEGKGVKVLDITGLAQKGGAVLSHIQIAAHTDLIHATRVPTGDAAVLIGCDAIVAASLDALSRVRRGRTRAVVNTASMPSAAFLSNPDWTFPGASAEADLRASIGEACEFVDANALALRLFGDTIFANPLLLGYAWQQGWIPLGRPALLRAIELNGVAVEKNQQAFEMGRVAAHDAAALPGSAPARDAGAVVLDMPVTLERVVRERALLLRSYGGEAYAQRYRDAVARLRAVEAALPGHGRLPLSDAVARNLAKLMAYKDEYEVARLYSAPEFVEALRAQFEGEPGKDYTLNFHLAPPLLAPRDASGRPAKRRYGPWMMPVFGMLARLRCLRGTLLDPFGYSSERRRERRLVDDYLALIALFCETLTQARLDTALELARLPEKIRGYGHVKEKAMDVADERRAQLMTQYGATQSQRQKA